MNVNVGKEALKIIEECETRYKKYMPVLGVCCSGFMGHKCGMEIKFYLERSDLKNYPTLELAIDNANRLAGSRYNEEWTETKQGESDVAVKNIKDLAEHLGIKPHPNTFGLIETFELEM